MTTDYTDVEADRILAAGLAAAEQMRERIRQIEQSRDEQPERLAAARAEAEKARDWAQIEEPWADQISAIPGYNANGDVTAMLKVPNMVAKEVAGARVAFDMLDAGEDDGRADDILARMFTMVGGDTGQAFLILASALHTVTNIVVPQLLDALEHDASDYTTRVMLAEACTKAWNERIGVLRLQRNMIVPADEPSVDEVDAAGDEPW